MVIEVVNCSKGSGMSLFSVYLYYLAQRAGKKVFYLDFELGSYSLLDRVRLLREVKHYKSKPRRV